jgi:hypothetical protein
LTGNGNPQFFLLLLFHGFFLLGKYERKRPLGRSRRRWEDFRIDLREIVWEGVDWMHLAQDRVQ